MEVEHRQQKYDLIIRDPIPSTIVLGTGEKWIMKLSEEGISFNREEFPNLTQDEFAESILDIFEKQFNVKFERK